MPTGEQIGERFALGQRLIGVGGFLTLDPLQIRRRPLPQDVQAVVHRRHLPLLRSDLLRQYWSVNAPTKKPIDMRTPPR